VSASGTSVADDELAAVDNTSIDPEVAREAARVDLDAPIDTSVPDGPPVAVPTVKPMPRDEAHELECIDAALTDILGDRPSAEFGNQDVQDRLTVHVSPSTLSRRLAWYEAGNRMVPPGAQIERQENIKRGRWRVYRTRPAPKR
jgi:hypothetical protein